MELYDRGTKKWVSLMLPEHVERVKDIFVEKIERPKLDEQQMDLIDTKLKYALNKNVNIAMTLYEKGQYKTVQGRLTEIDQLRGYIVLLSACGLTVSLSNIVNVDIVS